MRQICYNAHLPGVDMKEVKSSNPQMVRENARCNNSRPQVNTNCYEKKKFKWPKIDWRFILEIILLILVIYALL